MEEPIKTFLKDLYSACQKIDGQQFNEPFESLPVEDQSMASRVCQELHNMGYRKVA